MSKSRNLALQLIRAARGQVLRSNVQPNTSHPPLPCFALQKHHFGLIESCAGATTDTTHGNVSTARVPTPSDFHAHLCNRIRYAQDRVILASLYIGVGSNAAKLNTAAYVCKEDELLHALNAAARNPSIKKIQILLDANRALREVSFTSGKSAQSHSVASGSETSYSAKAVHSELVPFLQQRNDACGGVFLFPVNNFQLCSILPSPLGEVAGVFHIKAYIIDNELILSGANLSEEYFTNRFDRYMSFTDGGGGLVDFYAELCDILCKYAMRYDGSQNENTRESVLFSSRGDVGRKLQLEESLVQLFNGERFGNVQSEQNQNVTPPAVAYAIPTFQMPESFLGRPLRFHSDVTMTRNLLQSALDDDTSLSVRLSSAYLNLTPCLLSILTKFGKSNEDAIASNGHVYLLTAGSKSHGFAQKKQSKQRSGIINKIKDSIPDAFLSLVKQVAESIIKREGKVLTYERAGWTFHAKGLWITSNDQQQQMNVRPVQQELIHDSSTVVSTVIGSGNYGARSEDLDVESNLVLVFNDSQAEKESQEESKIKKLVAAEWNEMCRHSSELVDTKPAEGSENSVVQVAVALLKKFL